MDGAIKGRKWARSVLMQSNQFATSTANRYKHAEAKQGHIRSPQRLQTPPSYALDMLLYLAANLRMGLNPLNPKLHYSS